MDCLLCLELNTNVADCIQINSSTWNELNVMIIIEKHLWPMNAYKTESQWLCLSCWKILNEFHAFYMRIESAHTNLSSLMKSESDALDQTVVLVKQECKESENDESNSIYNVEDDIPLINISPCIDGFLRDPINDGEQSMEECKESKTDESNFIYNDEDDIPLINIRQCIDGFLRDPIKEGEHSTEDTLIKKEKTKNSKKRKAKSDLKKVSKTTKKVLHENGKEFKIKSVPDIPQTPNEISASSLIIEVNNSNCPLRYYYQSKMKTSEYDSFIAQHFKLVCNKCKNSVETFKELQQHFNEVHKKKHAYVICCGKKYRDRGSLVDHINIHINPEYFKCEHCPQVLTLRKNYNIHMRNHETVYGCEMCDKKFLNKYLVNKHKLTHLSEDEKKFPCDTCEKCFASENCLNVHQRAVHLRIYSKLCEICGQHIPNSETFKRHMEKHEGISEPTISCEICGRLMSNKYTLRKHMKFVHPADGKHDYICHICLRISPNKRALREHIQRVHTSGHNHKCTICNKAFKRIAHLKDHMATHTGVGTSKCPWCPKVFNANSSMHLHRKKVHPELWEEARLKRYSGKVPANLQAQPASDFQFNL